MSEESSPFLFDFKPNWIADWPQQTLSPGPVALALSGGGGRAFYQVGAVQALEDAGFSFAAIAGTSSGSIVGALLAAGYNGREVQRLLHDAHPPDWYSLGFGQGLVRPDGQQEWLEEVLPDEFSGLKIPFGVPTTDLQTGEEIIFRSGPLVSAIMASSAFTGAVYPPHCEGRWLTDGGLTNETPADLARTMAPHLPLVTLEVTAQLLPLDFPEPDEDGLLGMLPLSSPSVSKILLQAFTITQAHLTRRRLMAAKPEWLVDFGVSQELELHSLDQLARGVEIGYGIMQRHLDQHLSKKQAF